MKTQQSNNREVVILSFILTNKNPSVGTPASWRRGGEGELFLARIHLAHKLPLEGEPGKRQFFPDS